jgi:hypothetical protein
MNDIFFPETALNSVPNRKRKSSKRERFDETITEVLKPGERPVYDRFISGPIPLDWLLKAQAQGHAAFYVGVFLWYFCGMNGRRERFRVGIPDLMLGTISRKTVQRGMKKLQSAGLISRSTKRGSKGHIQLLDTVGRE